MSIKGKCHSSTVAKGHSDAFEIKFHMKAYGRIEMKIHTKKLGLMTNMAATPIYRKNLKLKKFLRQNLKTDELETWYVASCM